MVATAVSVAVAKVSSRDAGLVVWLVLVGLVLAAESPFALGIALLAVRPFTEAHNASIAIWGGADATPQQLWGAGAVVTLGLLLTRVDWAARKRVLLVSLALVLPGVNGALLGPVRGAALSAWFWIALAGAAALIGREIAPLIGFRAMAWTFVLPALVTIALAAQHGFAHSYLPFRGGRIVQLTGGFVSPHTLAFACLPLVVWMSAVALLESSLPRRFTAAALAALLAAVVVLTTIRTAQVAVVVVAVGVVVARVKQQRMRPLGRAARVVVAVGGLAIVGALASSSSVRDRWTHVFDSSQAQGAQWAGSGRGFLWHQALLNFQDSSLARKLFGSGWSASSVMTDHRIGTPFAPHDDALELLVAVGAVGLVCLALLALMGATRFISLRGRMRRAGADWFWSFAVAGVLSFATVSLLTGLMSYTTAAVSAGLFAGFSLAAAESPQTLLLVGEPAQRGYAHLRRVIEAVRWRSCETDPGSVPAPTVVATPAPTVVATTPLPPTEVPPEAVRPFATRPLSRLRPSARRGRLAAPVAREPSSASADDGGLRRRHVALILATLVLSQAAVGAALLWGPWNDRSLGQGPARGPGQGQGQGLARTTAPTPQRPLLHRGSQDPVYVGVGLATSAVRPLTDIWQFAEQAARENFLRFPGATVLKDAAVAAGLRLSVSRNGMQTARTSGTGMPVLDTDLSNPHRIVVFFRSSLGSVWQLAASPGHTPTFARAGTYAAAVLADAPVGYWRLDETRGRKARDSSGVGESGTYGGNVILGRSVSPVSAGQAVTFGGNGHVNLGDLSISLRRGAATTVELWVAPTEADLSGGVPFGFRFYSLYLRPHAIGFNTGNSDLLGASVPPLANHWHHIVAIFRNLEPRRNELYVDGERLQLTQRFGTTVPQSVSSEAQISGWPGISGNFLTGSVDEVAVYPRALSPGRIELHYRLVRRSR